MSDAKYTKEPTETFWPLITASNARGIAWSVRQGRLGGVSEEALAAHLEHSADIMEAQQKVIGGAHLDSSTVLLPADTLAKVRGALEMGAKLAQAQHVAKTYGACTDALSLLDAAQKQGEGE